MASRCASNADPHSDGDRHGDTYCNSYTYGYCYCLGNTDCYGHRYYTSRRRRLPHLLHPRHQQHRKAVRAPPSRSISPRVSRSTLAIKLMIAGFIVQGNAGKPVLLRGMGPSLAAFGIQGVLLDPVLELRNSNSSVATNDNWVDSPDRAQFEGGPFQPGDDRESVVLGTLAAGNYTALLTGKDNAAGVGIVEVYDRDQAADATLANISTRGFVQTGENVMIGGFILGGSINNTRVAIRGLGPSLAQFGLNPVLPDPTLELHDANGTTLVANDSNRLDDPVSAALLTANGLGLSDPKESGIHLAPPANSPRS